MIKNSDKEKYVYSGYRITFDSAGSWSFDNDLARDVIVFGTDNSSTSHSDNFKNNFLILVEVPTYGINGRFESPEKNININFAKANSKFYLSLHYVAGFFVSGKEIFNFNSFASTPWNFVLYGTTTSSYFKTIIYHLIA